MRKRENCWLPSKLTKSKLEIFFLRILSKKALYKTRECDNNFLGKPKNSRDLLIASTKGWPPCPKREPTALISKLTFFF